MLGLEHLGLDAKRDNITFLVIGDQTVATQALEGGQIDVTVLDGVFSRRLKQKGFTILPSCKRPTFRFPLRDWWLAALSFRSSARPWKVS